MDPNLILTLLRAAFAADDHEAAAGLAADLDEWMAKGGFLPDAWETNRPAPFTTGPMYAVHATYERARPDGYTETGGIPSFYLHPDVQGILTEEQAAKIAQDILRSGVHPFDETTFHVTAVRV